MFNCNGRIPLPVFQTIMIDYDLPFIDKDKVEMEKEGYLVTDNAKNEFIKYNSIFRQSTQAVKHTVPDNIIAVVLNIQKIWRGIVARRQVEKMRADGGFKTLG